MTSRFVILKHDYPYLHWDLMLEETTNLRTWRLHAEPIGTELITAEELPAHRKHYLDYEGPLSKNRGTVSQWDQGDYQILSCDENVLEICLNGIKQQVCATLSRDSSKNHWAFQLTGSSPSPS